MCSVPLQVFLVSRTFVSCSHQKRPCPAQVDLLTIRRAIEGAGYSVPETNTETQATNTTRSLSTFTRSILAIFGLVFGVVLLVVIVGEWLGFFERVTDVVPWYIGWGLVVLAGSPIFWNVLRAVLRRQILSHTLMSLGVVAALAVGQWPTAVVIVFFMRIGDYAEHFTTERSRQAVKQLSALDPQTARVERHGEEQMVPIAEVLVGEIILVRPGEAIPIDGEVIGGQATVNQAAITGEAMPVEVHAGSQVFAATIATLGSLRVKATHVGAETTFGRVITMVEEAEAHRAPIQHIADRFSASFLPVVATIALLTFLISRNLFAAAAVLVVACSCSFALATPIAMLASIGAAASRGLLIKGGKYLEALSRADVLLIDKTGTITEGRPQITTDVVALAGSSQQEVLAVAASAEHHSEHPLAEAVRTAAMVAGLVVQEPDHFEAVPGMGVLARVNGVPVKVGNARLVHSSLSILWARLIQADESLARTAGQVEAFCHMLRQRQGYRLRGWLEEVEQHGEPELQAFARNLHKEESAVQAGLTLAWSNGPTEGFIHRLKLLKRQAYGRAGVALLKQRMLFHLSDLIAA
jgi:Cu+-exporting ATPase